MKQLPISTRARDLLPSLHTHIQLGDREDGIWYELDRVTLNITQKIDRTAFNQEHESYTTVDIHFTNPEVGKPCVVYAADDDCFRVRHRHTEQGDQ